MELGFIHIDESEDLTRWKIQVLDANVHGEYYIRKDSLKNWFRDVSNVLYSMSPKRIIFTYSNNAKHLSSMYCKQCEVFGYYILIDDYVLTEKKK